MGGSSTVRVSATRIEAFKVQSSTYGATMPVGYGLVCVPVNLIWFGDFNAIAHTTTQKSGGKGGGGVKTKTTTYTYEAAGILSLMEGPITAVRTVLVGKEQRPWASAGLSLFTGAIGQAVWSHLTTNHPTEAVPYSGLAYMASPNYQLNDSAQLENHRAIVEAKFYGTFEFEANLPACVEDLLSSSQFGALIDPSLIDDFTHWNDYCRAFGLKYSPLLTEQISAAEMIELAASISNSKVISSEGLIKIIPLGDTGATANGSTYVPNVTPVYDLDDRVLLPLDGDRGVETIKIKRKPKADQYNHVRIEFLNRDRGHNIEIAEAKDQADIDVFGLRSSDVLTAHWITDSAVARHVAQLILQQALYTPNLYEFRLSWHFSHLEPIVDFVTLTDGYTGLVDVPVRITQIEEDEYGELRLTAEDAPPGISSTALYPTEVGNGFQPDYNAVPGDVHAPFFFEPPVELTSATGLEIWCAVTGDDPNWGGCEIWVSNDGLNYKQIGELFGGARYGHLTATLAATTGGTASVQLEGNGGQLLSGSADDATRLSTLIVIRGVNPADRPEWLAYETATLTGSDAYDLTGLVRGAYESFTDVKIPNSKFARIDDAIFKGPALQFDDIGKTFYFKLLSFNVYGAGRQELADVSDYQYVVRGDMALLPPDNVSTFLVSVQGDGTRQFDWAWTDAKPKPKDVNGVVIRYRAGHAGYTWDDMVPFETPGISSNQGYYTSSPFESNQLLAGDYTFAIRARDNFGVESTEADTLYQLVTFPDPRLGDALVYRVLSEEGFPGTLTDCVVDIFDGQTVLRAADQVTWSTLPSTWSAWTRWVWDPVTTWTYDFPQENFGAIVGYTPSVSYEAVGDVVLTESHSDDGVTWSAYAPLAGIVNARYARIRMVVSVPSGSPTGPGVTPITYVRRIAVAYKGKLTTEIANDVDPSTLGANRISAGYYKMPLTKPFVRYSRWGVTLQNVGPGWDVDYIDTSIATGFTFKTYNGSGVAADAPLIDFWMEGITP